MFKTRKEKAAYMAGKRQGQKETANIIYGKSKHKPWRKAVPGKKGVVDYTFTNSYTGEKIEQRISEESANFWDLMLH